MNILKKRLQDIQNIYKEKKELYNKLCFEAKLENKKYFNHLKKAQTSYTQFTKYEKIILSKIDKKDDNHYTLDNLFQNKQRYSFSYQDNMKLSRFHKDNSFKKFELLGPLLCDLHTIKLDINYCKKRIKKD